jgi:hypothetical protein
MIYILRLNFKCPNFICPPTVHIWELINKILQKPRRLNLKFMSAVNNDNKTNGNRYNSQSCQFQVIFFY